MTEQLPKPKSRRGHGRFDHNPSLPEAQGTQKVGVKRITGKDGMSLIVSDQNTGEVVAPVGFHQRVPVDRTQFVKMYIHGIRALQGLKLAGARVFELIFAAVQESPGTDKIYLHFMDTLVDGTPSIPESTFHRGLTELLDKGFIYESLTPHMYWINITYMFNGDRFAFIREYYIDDTPKPKKAMKVSDNRQADIEDLL